MTKTEIPVENVELSEEAMRAQVEADLADVNFREPVIPDDDYRYAQLPDENVFDWRTRALEIDREKAAAGEHIDKNWLMLLETARRNVLKDPQLRRTAATFTAEPLSELLPLQAVEALAKGDPRTAKVAKFMDKSLGAMLRVDPVPDEALSPDLRTAGGLVNKAREVDNLMDHKQYDPEGYKNHLHYAKERINKYPGITEDEKKLVARRYRYARDVKLLGLMAELHDQPAAQLEAQNGLLTHELDSGTKLVMTEEAFVASPDLLNPEKWQQRGQLKDRVYVVEVGDQYYIMKERKTDRHTDVKKHGHVDGLTSEEEFKTAQYFADLGTIEQDNIKLRWEKPLGYVEFPDGYQFCMFEYNPNLSTNDPSWTLRKLLQENPEAYQAEFEAVQQRARELLAERADLVGPLLNLGQRKDPRHPNQQPDELTMEEFLDLKARHTIQQAKDLLSDTMLNHGYVNSDLDGFGFKVNEGNPPSLEIMGFDFEYYQQNPDRAKQTLEHGQKIRASGEAATMRSHVVSGNRPIVGLASYAMLEADGMALPSKRY